MEDPRHGFGPKLDAAGLEFVIFDMEDGRCGIELAGETIASCRGLEVTPMMVPGIFET